VADAHVRPEYLELTAADELLAMENLDVLRQNGFEVEVDEEISENRPRLKLLAQPVSKNTLFDVKGEHPITGLQLFFSHMLSRSGRAHSTLARPTNRANGKMLEGESHVCNESL
jgi:hypothetical protein